MITECTIFDENRQILGIMRRIRIENDWWVGDACFFDFEIHDRYNVRFMRVRDNVESFIGSNGVIYTEPKKLDRMTPKEVSTLDLIQRIRDLELQVYDLKHENARLKKEIKQSDGSFYGRGIV